jgi:FMN-dependent NADH-azoreductase
MGNDTSYFTGLIALLSSFYPVLLGSLTTHREFAMKLLHIDSSALGGHSVSRQLTASIVAQLQRAEPGIDISYRDLAANPLPHWTPASGSGSDQPGGDALAEFLAADVIVIGAPMYNFAISSQLKAWLDRILVAGQTFRYGANGPEGLAGGKRVIIGSSRGGFYGAESPAAAMDFQEPYLRAALAFIGITEVTFVRAEGIAVSDVHKAEAIAAAGQQIELLAA